MLISLRSPMLRPAGLAAAATAVSVAPSGCWGSATGGGFWGPPGLWRLRWLDKELPRYEISARSPADKFEQPPAALTQLVDRGRIRDPDESGRVEGLARRDGHARVVEQRLCEIRRCLDGAVGQDLTNVGKQIKRARRFEARGSRIGGQALMEAGPALSIYVEHRDDRRLRTGQRRDRALLRD